jgi:DNA-binding PadR family transcriptional regulator
MSDAYAAPGPWAAGSARKAHRGPRSNENHPHQSRRRDDRQARREAFLAAMGADEAPIDENDGRRGRGRGRQGGPGRFGPPGAGFGGPRGGRGGRGGGRARRGDVRAAILALLAEEPRNGYGVIQEIEERSNGVWKPSPGAVYPAFQQLEDEALIRPVEVEGRKLFELTDAGRAYVSENAAQVDAPWAAVADETGTSYRDAKHQFAQLWHAYAAVHQDGTPAQVEAAQKVMSDARRSLYRILAEDDASTTER